jgi:hypothetical protein
MASERPMDDVQEKEKAYRQGGASRTYSWPKKRGLEAQREAVTHTWGEIVGYTRVSGSPTWRMSKDVGELI